MHKIGQEDGLDMPAPDQLVAEVDARRADVTVDHGLRGREEVFVVGPGQGERDHEGGAADPPARPTCALLVIGRRRRDVAKEDGLQVPKVDAQLECRRAAEDVDLAFVGMVAVLEGLLIRRGQLRRKLGRVLAGGKGDGALLWMGVAPPVVVLGEAIPRVCGFKQAIAPEARADP